MNLNCRSINSKFYMLDLHHKFNIITITETWFRSSTDLSYFQLDGYDMYHLDRGNKNVGGVAIYIQNTLKHTIINHMTYAMDDVLECLSVEVLLHSKDIVISCLYKHPTCTIDELVGNHEKLCKNKQCDDFNINILNQTTNVTSEFLQCLYSLCMFPLIYKPTHITNHSATLIKKNVSNAYGISHNSGILVIDISDHPSIFTIREENLVTCMDVVMASYIKVINQGKKNMKIFCEKNSYRDLTH